MNAEEYFKEWMQKQGYEYNNIPIPELMESYHKSEIEVISDEMILNKAKQHFYKPENLGERLAFRLGGIWVLKQLLKQ